MPHAPADHPLLAVSQLAYEQANAALARQQDALHALAGRAAMLGSTSAVSASFLAGSTISRGSPGPLTWIAIAAFTIAFIATLLAAAPSGRIERPLRATVLLRAVSDDVRLLDAGAAHRAVARHLDVSRARNEAWLVRSARYLLFALVLQGIAVLCWVADLATRG